MIMKRPILKSLVFTAMVLILSCSDDSPVANNNSRVVTDISWIRNGETVSAPDGVVTMRITVEEGSDIRIRNIPYEAGTARIGPYPIGTVLNVLWEALDSDDQVIFSGQNNDIHLGDVEVRISVELEAVRHKVKFISVDELILGYQLVSHGDVASEPTPPTRPGFRFDAWSLDQNRKEVWNFKTDVVNSSMILYALWSETDVEQFTVTYHGNQNSGGVIPVDPNSYEEGDEVRVLEPGNLVKSGFSFSAWNTSPDGKGKDKIPKESFNIGSSNVILYAKWLRDEHVDTFTVTFQTNGGSSIDPRRVVSGDTVTAPLAPEKEGAEFQFAGWFLDQNFDVLWSFSTPVTEDITLYAKWVELFSLHYSAGANGALTGDTIQTVRNGENGRPVYAEAVDGYVFSQWSDGVTENPRTDTNVKENISVAAQFKTVANDIFTVTFKSDGKFEFDPVQVPEGRTVPLPLNLSRIGYEFDRWYADSAKSIPWDTSTIINENITLYANWTPNEYTITFDAQEGSTPIPETIVVTYDNAYGSLAETSRLWYDFDGWFTEDSIEIIPELTVNITEHLTLYARWSPTEYNIVYRLNGGEENPKNPKVYTVEESVELKNPSRTGHRFVGWYVGPEFNVKITEIPVGSYGDRTIYAKWRPENYEVTFNVPGASAVPPQTVSYRNKIAEPDPPVKPHFLFAGWYKDGLLKERWDFDNDVVTSNMTLYAKWGRVADGDGNVYTTVIIGNQEWTVENLRATKYSCGTPIHHITNASTWSGLSIPAYSYFNNTDNQDSIIKFGALYNWWVLDPNNQYKIAPDGWKVPERTDWITLRDYLVTNGFNWDGSKEDNKIGKALASNGGEWSFSTTEGNVGNDQSSNNRTGFTALPGGFRNSDGPFSTARNTAYWWSSTGHGDGRYASAVYLKSGNENLIDNYVHTKNSGYSVRFVRYVD
ncbi:cell wall/surface repeat protein [Chitinispirillum alkaliphilum]|nr:cell wall/surface repeat protein [Chitinispirillum alkaliphilum]